VRESNNVAEALISRMVNRKLHAEGCRTKTFCYTAKCSESLRAAGELSQFFQKSPGRRLLWKQRRARTCFKPGFDQRTPEF
jgi:hypothetical protein